MDTEPVRRRLCLCLSPLQAAGPEVPPAGEEALPEEIDGLRLLDAVVVSGVQPGPGLWKVSKDGRVMWVLATLSPLPKRMEAKAQPAWMAEAEKALAIHAETVAMLSIAQVIGPSGYPAALAQRGYTVESPEGVTEPGAVPTGNPR